MIVLRNKNLATNSRDYFETVEFMREAKSQISIDEMTKLVGIRRDSVAKWYREGGIIPNKKHLDVIRKFLNGRVCPGHGSE